MHESQVALADAHHTPGRPPLWCYVRTAVAERDPAAFELFLKEYIHGPADFNAYLERCGGLKRLQELRRREVLQGE